MSKIERPFDEELILLKDKLLEMASRTEEQIGLAIRGLKDRKEEMACEVLDKEEGINRLDIEVDDMAMRLLALRQPMATDLRFITSAMKIGSDLERIGDLAVNIAEAALRYLDYTPVKPLVDLPRMAAIAQGMLRDALDSYVRHDVALARAVLERDDQLDDLKTQIFRELLTFMIEIPAKVGPALELILISRHLERIGDHATNVGEDVIFMVSAEDVRHAIK